MEGELLFRLVAFCVLMALSAAFSGSETAFFSLARTRVEGLRRQGGLGERIARLLDRPRRLIISVLMGNEMVNIAASAMFTGAVVIYLGEARTWLAPVLMTPLLMVFGEITPKSVAARFPETGARLLVVPLSLFARLVSPLRWVVLQIANAVLTLLGVPPRARQNLLLEDEFLSLVDVGHAEGQLEATERALIHNVFEFHDRAVEDVLVPRTDMVCWEEGLTMQEVADRVRCAAYSRVPVYRGDRDHIVGILYVKDFLRLAVRRTFDPGERLDPRLLREPLYVPEGMKLDALFRLFRQKRTHMAIVADEFGGVTGLVTMKDLLEEIFGEIRDEHGEGQRAWIHLQEDGSYLCQARVTVEEFAEVSGWRLPDYEEANTLGGLVFTQLGRVPRVNDKVRMGEVLFTALEVRRTRVVRVRAEKA